MRDDCMNLRQIRKDVEKLKRETNAARLAGAERSGDSFEIFVELSRQDGVKLTREQLRSEFDRHEIGIQNLIAEGRIDPSEMTTLDWFIALCRVDGIEMTDDELKAQYDVMSREKTARSRTAFN